MFFNSIDFAVFLPVVFAIYWFTQRYGLLYQNIVLLSASYIFYGWWDWKFLSLITISIVSDYFIAHKIHNESVKHKRKKWLWLSLFINLGMLAIFKYFNFFVDNFVEAFQFFGANINSVSLKIILPVGISFYTFQTLSYTIDIYREKIKPSNNFIAFASFVSFFPQLVAGPIERASHLLPQFSILHKFDYHKAVDGSRQILWGMFKKVVIADNCAEYVNVIFAQSDQLSGFILVLGAIFFGIQIYCDFSGYSDIAIGTARLFGFDLKQNFAFPYFSRNVGEFWRRWHISLTSWFRDYLYIPLGGSRSNTIRNIFIIFIVSGFWHGANWTFFMWGLTNALFFLPSILMKQNRKYLDVVAQGKYLPSPKEVILMLTTFGLISFSWIFFRAENLSHALVYVYNIFTIDFFKHSFIPPDINIFKYAFSLFFILVLLIIEWLQRHKQHGLELKNNQITNWAIYLSLTSAIFLFGGGEHQFIYFQF